MPRKSSGDGAAFATGTPNAASTRYATRWTVPAPSDVPSVIDWIDRIPLSPAASMNWTNVPAAAVAGNECGAAAPTVAIRPAVFDSFV